MGTRKRGRTRKCGKLGGTADIAAAIRPISNRTNGCCFCVLTVNCNAAKEKEEKLMCSILCYAGKDVTKETMEGYLLKTKMRGPDAQQVVET